MAKYVPDNTAAYEADLDNIIWNLQGNGVISGLTVAAQGSPNMTVNVASGSIAWNGASVASAGNAALAIGAADPSNQRIDLVVVNSAGAVSVVAGTPATTPKPPSLPANSLLIALVSVAAGALNIQNSNISSRILSVPSGRYVSGPTVTTGLTTVGASGITFNDSTNQTTAAVTPYPNLALNSDFGRRTVFGLAMPEVFADTSGFTAVDGSIGSVASNVLTAGTNGTWSVKWCGTNATFYRDGRWSALVKQLGTGTTNTGRIGIGKTDGTAWLSGNGVYATYYRTGASTVTLELIKVIAGVVTVVASQAGVTWTDGRVGWAELEAQGTTYIARFYDQGSGTPGLKSAATRLDTTVISGTISDSAVTSGQPAVVNGSGVGAATVWGGIASGNGGVYVETWLPESVTVVFDNTLGGQAIGFDESTDAGALTKQWALRSYIPATSRSLYGFITTPTGAVVNSTAYTNSVYQKVSGLGGSGSLIECLWSSLDVNLAVLASHTSLFDGGSTSWSRKTATDTSHASARAARIYFGVNRNMGTGATRTATGTAYFSCAQLEQGSAATAWRNAPDDGPGPLVWELPTNVESVAPGNYSTTSASFTEVDSRDLAANIFLPYDARVKIEFLVTLRSSQTAAVDYLEIRADGNATPGGNGVASIDFNNFALASRSIPVFVSKTVSLAAGKHRIAVLWQSNGGTLTAFDPPKILTITATRGK